MDSEKVVIRDFSRNDYSAKLVKENGSSFQVRLLENDKGLFAMATKALLPLYGNSTHLDSIKNGDVFEIMEAIVEN